MTGRQTLQQNDVYFAHLRLTMPETFGNIQTQTAAYHVGTWR